jgi:hypothetical protein
VSWIISVFTEYIGRNTNTECRNIDGEQECSNSGILALDTLASQTAEATGSTLDTRSLALASEANSIARTRTTGTRLGNSDSDNTEESLDLSNELIALNDRFRIEESSQNLRSQTLESGEIHEGRLLLGRRVDGLGITLGLSLVSLDLRLDDSGSRLLGLQAQRNE